MVDTKKQKKLMVDTKKLKNLTDDQIRELKKQGYSIESLKSHDADSDLFYEKDTGQIFVWDKYKRGDPERVTGVRVARDDD